MARKGENLAFPDVLFEAVRDIASKAGTDRALLLLFDDRARAFGVAATLGVPVDATKSIPCPGHASTLRRLLDGSGTTTYASLEDVYGGPVSIGFEKADESILSLPLEDDSLVGVVLIPHSSTSSSLPNVQSAAREWARWITESRHEFTRDSLLARMLDIDSSGIALLQGEEFVVTYRNASFGEVIGNPGAPLLGRPFADIFPGDDGARLGSIAREVATTGKAHHESSFELKDEFGSRYFEARVDRVDNDDLSVPAVCLILSPRTDSVLIRQALEDSNVRMGESQSLLEALLEHTNNGIFLVDTDLTVLYTNQRMGELFAFDPHTVTGKSKIDVVDGVFMDKVSDPEKFRERLLYLYGHMDEIAQDEVEVVRPVHRILDRYSAPVYRKNGSMLGRLELYYDVTEVRQLQRSKDEFLSVVSHELRTPITSIKGYAQLLQRRARKEELPPQIALAYSTIERQAVRMQELIDTLLDMSRLDADRLRLDLRAVDLVALASHCVEILQIVSDSHVLSIDVPPHQVVVSGDEKRLEQVVTNLLTNAVRYSPDGASVTISVRESDETATISVVDQGIGIAPDAMDRVFERFYRATDVPQSTGLGIGLYITRGIVERHGGQISVSSTVGRGSEFAVSLPLHTGLAPDDC